MDRSHSHIEQQGPPNDEREATEMRGSEGERGTPADLALGSIERGRSRFKCVVAKISFPLRKFWRQQVFVFVPHDTCRDHLGMYQALQHSVSDPSTWVVVIKKDVG